ncbi:MAG: hypothetical protein ACRDSP_05565 [Pseudonocardiaceae bacterium]
MREHYRRPHWMRWVVAVIVTVSCLLVAACGNAPPTRQQRLVVNGSTPATQVTRTSGDSQIDIPGGDPAGAGASLRGCPAAVDQAQAQQSSVTCLPIDRLANHTLVTMRCWIDATGSYAVPAGFTSPRWFYVTEVNGLHPGYSGYLYSGMIPPVQQVITPHCNDQILSAYPLWGPKTASTPLTLTIDGTCTADGGTLTSRTSGFVSGITYYITATYPDGSAYPSLSAQPVTARPDGTVPWTWPCKGDPPGTYTTSIGTINGRESTGDIHFTIGHPPRLATSNASPPAPQVTRTAPVTPPSTGRAHQSATRQITVYNKVTNGPTSMRDDPNPAYLSTVTHNYCRTHGCMLPGTAVTTGTTLTTQCQIQGDRTTNGEDKNSIDDTNPGLDTSTLWYGITWPDGRFGYISEVWINPAERGGLGLPAC